MSKRYKLREISVEKSLIARCTEATLCTMGQSQKTEKGLGLLTFCCSKIFWRDAQCVRVRVFLQHVKIAACLSFLTWRITKLHGSIFNVYHTLWQR